MSRRSIRRAVAIGSCVAGALAALVFFGCGGSSGPALTKAEFIEHANKICREGEAKRGQRVNELLEGSAKKAATASGKDQIVFEILSFYEETTGELAALGKPKGEEEKAEAVIDAMEQAAERVKADPQSAATSDLPFRKANKLAEAYGMSNCAT